MYESPPLSRYQVLISSRVPPNVKFLIDDIDADWIYKQPFDFIHARFLAASIKDYKRLLQQAYELSSLSPPHHSAH